MGNLDGGEDVQSQGSGRSSRMIDHYTVMLIVSYSVEYLLKYSFLKPNSFFDPPDLITISRKPYNENIGTLLNHGLQAEKVLKCTH